MTSVKTKKHLSKTYEVKISASEQVCNSKQYVYSIYECLQLVNENHFPQTPENRKEQPTV